MLEPTPVAGGACDIICEIAGDIVYFLRGIAQGEDRSLTF